MFIIKETPKYKIGDYFGQYQNNWKYKEGCNKIETQKEVDYMNSDAYKKHGPEFKKDGKWFSIMTQE